jgi:hypothetical protein
MTPADHAVGEQAAHAFLSPILGWKEFMVRQYEPKAVQLIVETADKQAGDVPTKEHAAAMALYRSISDAGYGGQVTSTQCASLCVAVYQAVLKARGLPVA